MMIKPWMLAALGLVAFAILVWVAGPLLVIGGQAPLASTEARLLLIGIFILQYVAQRAWGAWQARRRNEKVVAALVPAPRSDLSAEGQVLRERFATALEQLRRMRLSSRGPWKLGRSYLYQLPWYMIIGAPGSGKTTALLNAGLNFPLAQKVGKGSVRGFGGTRNCDWWFTDRAVLIDTAGRYTTQDSDHPADRQAWDTFLQLLLRARPRRPLNGVLVAVSIGDLLEFSPDELRAHARTLRARLEELQGTLKVRIPVYLLLTKCDLLPGFVDWFGGLSRPERDQVWGVTFDLRVDSGRAADFTEQFEQLVNRLADLLLARLQSERDTLRRSRIFALPSQLQALRERAATLVQGVFGSSGAAGAESSTLLRGVYLTSGTQSGTPIDRMLSALGSELGLEAQILPPNQASGRSFFLANVLNDVVLAESDLDGRSPWRQRKRQHAMVAAAAGVLLVSVLVGIVWTADYLRTVREIARFKEQVGAARSAISELPASVGSSPRTLLPALDAVRSMGQQSQDSNQLSELANVGARARRKMASAGQDAYARLLLGPFLQQIAGAIDTTLRAGADPNLQYEALKAYRVLTEPLHFDAAGLRVFVISHWNSTLQPALSPRERAALRAHLDALLRAGAVGSGLHLQPDLVDSVRVRLSSQPLTQQIALRLDVLLDSAGPTDFAVSSLGSDAGVLFVGADGHSEPKHVPGRYTLSAYSGVVQKQVAALEAQLLSESGWVLGVSRTQADADPASLLRSYRGAYAQAWDDFVDDLHLRHAVNNQEAAKQARVLGAPDGPLAAVLREIARQTPVRLPDGSAGPVELSLTDRFPAIDALMQSDASGRSGLTGVLEAFRQLQSIRGSGGDPSDQQLARIVTEAKREPDPVRSILLSLATISDSLGAGEQSHASGSALSRQIASKLAVPCLQLVAGHFPFDRRSQKDASLEDFARLFGPKGTFDGAFSQFLKGRVDTSSDNWRWLAAGSAAPEQELERFRAAARIRTVFFAHGGNRPGLQLTFRPVDMDETLDRFQLDIDGQTLRYAHGPTQTTVIQWPGAVGGARIQVTPAGPDAALAYTGPWALFRLLDHAAVRDSDVAGHFEIIFDAGGGRHATFDVTTESGDNPFRMSELEHFECPMASQ